MSSPGVIQSGAKADGAVADAIMGGNRGAQQCNTPEEMEVVKLVSRIYQKSKQWQETWSKNDVRFWNLWESNHYKGRVSRTITQAIINQVWSSVETVLGHVSDGLPDPNTTSRRPEFKEKAKKCAKWLKYVADRNDLSQEIQHPTRSACVTGLGWLSVEWDMNADGGRGDVVIKAVDEKFMFTSPYARNLQEALYVIEAKNIPRETMLKLYPDRGQYVPPGVWDGTLNNLRTYAESNRQNAGAPDYSLLTTTTGNDSHWSGSSGVAGGNKSDLVTLLKAYIRQDDGTMRLVVVANGVLLSDDLSPYDDDDFPYVPFNVVPTLDTLKGRSLVQFIEGLQDLLNQAVSLLIDQQRFAADPMLIVSAMNLEDGQLVDNRPGAVLPDSDPQKLGYNWLQAPGFNAAWLQIQELINGYMDSVLGRVDILKGERPAGVNTLGGLEIIRDEANVRMRTMIRWIMASVKRMYLLALSRLRQFAKDERTLRVPGSRGQDEYVTVNQVTGVTPEGQLEHDETIPENAEYEIEFGKQPMGGKQAEIELAMNLAALPAEDGLPMIDRQKMLEVVEYDDAPEIMERMAAIADQQAQAMAAQAPGGAAGQPQAPPEGSGDPVQEFMALFQQAA